jgi:hypothetical protein
MNAAPARTADSTYMKLSTMNHSLLPTICALTFGALLTPHAFADSSRGIASTPFEPRRIYDAEKERFVPNPDYRSPVALHRAVPIANPGSRPRRIFNTETERFISNPDYHQPLTHAPWVLRVGEPRRIFDAEKGRFLPNPAYRGTATVAPEDSVAALTSKPVVGHHTKPSSAAMRSHAAAGIRQSGPHAA